MNIALSAVVCLALLACVASAIAVRSAWHCSQSAKKLRSTASTLAELAEIRDYMGKLDQWAKRINSREAMRDSRARQAEEHSTPSSTPASSNESKDELRRRARLIAGQPANHGEH